MEGIRKLGYTNNYDLNERFTLLLNKRKIGIEERCSLYDKVSEQFIFKDKLVVFHESCNPLNKIGLIFVHQEHSSWDDNFEPWKITTNKAYSFFNGDTIQAFNSSYNAINTIDLEPGYSLIYNDKGAALAKITSSGYSLLTKYGEYWYLHEVINSDTFILGNNQNNSAIVSISNGRLTDFYSDYNKVIGGYVLDNRYDNHICYYGIKQGKIKYFGKGFNFLNNSYMIFNHEDCADIYWFSIDGIKNIFSWPFCIRYESDKAYLMFNNSYSVDWRSLVIHIKNGGIYFNKSNKDVIKHIFEKI